MIGTRSIEHEVSRIEHDLEQDRQIEEQRREDVKQELKSRLAEPNWLLGGFAGGLLLAFVLTPDRSKTGDPSAEPETNEQRGKSDGESLLHKLIDHGLVVLRTYLTALVAHHAIERTEDHSHGGEQ